MWFLPPRAVAGIPRGLVYKAPACGKDLLKAAGIGEIGNFFFNFLAAPRSLQDLSLPTRDQTCTPSSGSTES